MRKGQKVIFGDGETGIYEGRDRFNRFVIRMDGMLVHVQDRERKLRPKGKGKAHKPTGGK